MTNDAEMKKIRDLVETLPTPRVRTEFVYIHETWAQSVGKDAVTFFVTIAIMLLGRALDSQAAQWIAFIVLLALAGNRVKNGWKACKTTDEARAQLDAIDHANRV